MIQPEAAELLESPCSLIVCTVDADRLPDATRAWGVDVLSPTEVRVLLADNATTCLDNLRTTGVLALTATHFVTAVSYQLKGRARPAAATTPEDRIRFDRFCAGCVAAVHEIHGTPEEVVWRMAPPGIVAYEMTVDAVFDQTPGPRAGERLSPTGVPQ
jgi:hypothetical protein